MAYPATNDRLRQRAEKTGEQEAGKWLALVDGGQYQESWERAASLFKQQVNAEQWSQALAAARTPLGALVSRQLLSAAYETSLPGAPDGEYVILQFQTRFKNKKSAIETVTPMMDNGNWRVSGYYIR
ncbi:MAG: DUF4019 domain-containing protein [Gammaproteobacteria bacterium]|nr:MAG: DUF4019 domain-containing protein [Gammaproteobacteria bacterium]